MHFCVTEHEYWYNEVMYARSFDSKKKKKNLNKDISKRTKKNKNRFSRKFST